MYRKDAQSPLHVELRELRALLDDVAEIDWRHPAWWGLTFGTTLLGAYARAAQTEVPHLELYTRYLSAQDSPRSDTFMGRQADRPPGGAAARLARAVLRARAATDALALLRNQFPGQPLDCTLERDAGWLEKRALPAGLRTVAFVLPHDVYLADLAPGSEARLCAALARAVLGLSPRSDSPLIRLATRSGTATPAPVAVALGNADLAAAWHLHRRAWTRGGGPWLGLGDASPLELVTTCHLGVDGYGHARLATEIFAHLDQTQAGEDERLRQAARAELGAAEPCLDPAASVRSEPVGFAGRVLDGHDVGFPESAYAFGRTLERLYRAHLSTQERSTARFSPTFQVPIAPGRRRDDQRRRGRILHGLMSLRMDRGQCEPFADFRARLPTLLGREAAAEGILTRVLSAAASAPLPRQVQRRLLSSSGLPRPWLPPVEVLAGRGGLSSLRFLPGEVPPAPLFAASTPALGASPRDPLGSVVLTLVYHDGARTASLAGTGLAQTTAGAETFLDVWQAELMRLRP
jgi:hypothetical protein